MQYQFPNLNYDNCGTFFSSLFTHLRIFLLESKTTKLPKLESRNLGYDKSIHEAVHLHFGGNALHGLGQTRQKLVITKFNARFY